MVGAKPVNCRIHAAADRSRGVLYFQYLLFSFVSTRNDCTPGARGPRCCFTSKMQRVPSRVLKASTSQKSRADAAIAILESVVSDIYRQHRPRRDIDLEVPVCAVKLKVFCKTRHMFVYKALRIPSLSLSGHLKYQSISASKKKWAARS